MGFSTGVLMPKKAFEVMRNISVLYSGTFAFLGGILAIILLEKGLDLVQIAFYYALYSLVVFLLEIPTGAFADAYGRKKAIAIGFILLIIFLAGFLILPLGPIFIAFALIVAAGDAMMSGSAEAYVVDMLSERGKMDYMHKLLAFSKSWFFSMFLVGSIIGGYLATFSINYPIILCLIFAVSGLFYSLFGLSEKRSKEDFTSAEKNTLSNMSDAVKLAMKNTSIRILMLLSILFGLGAAGFFTYWQPIMKDIAGWNTDALGIFFALISIMLIVGSRLSTYLKPSWNTVVLLFLGLSISLFFASWVAVPLLLAILILIWELFLGIYLPIESTITNRNTPSPLRATVISVRAMAFRAGWVLFGFLVFFIGADEPRVFWVIGAGFLLLGALYVLLKKSKEN